MARLVRWLRSVVGLRSASVADSPPIVHSNRADGQIVRAFMFLETEYAFCRTRTEYSASCFGNVIAEYRSPRLWIQVTRDRSQILCDFSRPGPTAEWFDLDTVLADLGAARTLGALLADEWSSLESVAASVRDAIDRIVELFTEQNYPESCRRFQEFQQRRVDELLRFGAGGGEV